MSIPYIPGLLKNEDVNPLAGPSLLRNAPEPTPPSAMPITARMAPRRQSIFERFRDALMPQPEGLGGMVSPEMQSSAQRSGLLDAGISLLNDSGRVVGGPAPSMGQALAHGLLAARAGHQQSLEQGINNSLLTDDQDRKQQLQSVRQAIQRKYAPAPGASSAQVEDSLKQMFNEYVRIGDTEMVGKLAQVMPSLNHDKDAKPVEHIDLGDKVAVVDALTGKVLGVMSKGATPKTPAEIDAGLKFHADQKNKILDDYARDTKDFHQVMAGWDVLQGATKDPTLATPFAITDAYARITNPGAIVRPTTLEMIHDMGSVGQKMQKWWAQNANGSLPPDIVRDFQKTLYNIVKNHKTQYDQIRGKAITRAKQSGIDDISSLLEDYQLDDPLAATTPPKPGSKGSSATIRQFLKK